jgi:predicted O-linked N-acetylglucosamine transferase (SPINDLY family)
MGLPQLVAHTEQQYVDLAVTIARDPNLAAGLRAEIRQKRATLFDDLVPIRAFEQFLTNAVSDTLEPLTTSFVVRHENV